MALLSCLFRHGNLTDTLWCGVILFLFRAIVFKAGDPLNLAIDNEALSWPKEQMNWKSILQTWDGWQKIKNKKKEITCLLCSWNPLTLKYCFKSTPSIPCARFSSFPWTQIRPSFLSDKNISSGDGCELMESLEVGSFPEQQLVMEPVFTPSTWL